jgi:DNA-binding CsgD family transcriptional regulator
MSFSPEDPACIALKRPSTTALSAVVTDMEPSGSDRSVFTMPGHIPTLDEEALDCLRRYVVGLGRPIDGTLPMEQLVGLARDVQVAAGLTIDLRASEKLGAPLVVVRFEERSGPVVALDGLSRRESQVCALIAAGRSNKQIASKLFITLATVKDHVHKILRKTGMPNRAAVAVAYRDAQAGSDRLDEAALKYHAARGS